MRLRPLVSTATMIVLVASVAGTVCGVRIGFVPRSHPWWKRPWTHWCLWDSECRSHGAPRRIYVFPLFVEFPRDPELESQWIFEHER